MPDFIVPDWPAPAHVRALQTTRIGGCSPAPWASFNLGDHVGDDPARVAANRTALRRLLPGEPCWLRQVHGTVAVDVGKVAEMTAADAAWTARPGTVCAVMTADCLPVLFCDRAGTTVAAAHAGWRGLAAGVLEAAIVAMNVAPGELLAWLGPAIGPANFEVGDEVRAAFLAHDPSRRHGIRHARPRQVAGRHLCARRPAAGCRRRHGDLRRRLVHARRPGTFLFLPPRWRYRPHGDVGLAGGGRRIIAG